jgi:nucleoside phosphorylase
MTKKILIISALAEEMAPITQYLGLSQVMNVGNIVEHEGYIFAVSSVGKVSAALMLTKVLERYGDIGWIINIGLAGSLSPHLTFGDVVMVQETVEHDGLIEGDKEAQERLYPLFQLTTVEHPELKQ